MKAITNYHKLTLGRAFILIVGLVLGTVPVGSIILPTQTARALSAACDKTFEYILLYNFWRIK